MSDVGLNGAKVSPQLNYSAKLQTFLTNCKPFHIKKQQKNQKIKVYSQHHFP